MIKKNSYKLWYNRPAEGWNDALPLGNGRIGAMVFGRVERERIQLNEDTIWYGGPRDRLNPDAPKVLGKVRELLFAGKVTEAEFLAESGLQATPRHQNPYQTLGDLEIRFFGSEHIGGDVSCSDYRRELDLDEATVRVSYSSGGVRFERQAFSSFP